MKTIKNIAALFKSLTRFELILWLCSVSSVTLAFITSSLAFGNKSYLTLVASLIGLTALIFVAKGRVAGQVLTVVFAVLYGIISWGEAYYGEMITYLCMTSPIAISTAVVWKRNPYRGSKEVTVGKISPKTVIILSLLTVAITWGFYYLLRFFNTANLIVSTISVATSFAASSLTFLRSPYYALAYAANDLVLITLWISSSINDISYIAMVACFVAFFINDVYGFVNWHRMSARQQSA